ncbi:DUF2057 family protein [Vibrio sinaloensis]|uniref:YccT family protein n=1 Tax=Photobacterium sp. (strain ATCC 43367) TaxID=379097 RepID=UPI0022AFF9AF|nr:DUF2057 family protein [Vibrio sinaloensis]MCZ4295062.1 DUF2057 family protein [Vibrio sinaloensis]
MKRISILLASVVSFYASAADLIPAKGVSVLFINGQAAQSKLGENAIDEGFNQVVIRMDKDLGRGTSGDVFTSKPYVVNLQVSGDQVRIDHPSARSIREAELAFENDEPHWLIEQDGKVLSYEQEVLQGKSGLFPYSGMAVLVEQHNNQRGIYFDNGQLIEKPVEAQAIAVATTSSAVASTTSKVEKTSPAKPVASSNVEQLKAWYLKSSKQERKEFRRWMIDQE